MAHNSELTKRMASLAPVSDIDRGSSCAVRPAWSVRWRASLHVRPARTSSAPGGLPAVRRRSTSAHSGVDLVFNVLGGDIVKRSAGLIRAGGTLVTIAGATEARPSAGLTIDFLVVLDRGRIE